MLQRENSASSVKADAAAQLRRSMSHRVPLMAHCLTMSPHVERSRPKPLADEPYRKPAPPQAHKAGGIPGIRVIVCCLAIDLALILLTPAVGKLADSEPSESIALGALYGIIAAQIAMAVI